jgi:hypothetical protein
MFQVRKKACATCIYGPRSPTRLSVAELEAEVRDDYIGFRAHRACHHHNDGTCCRGFWDRHKNEFPAGQIAQRLNLVVLV